MFVVAEIEPGTIVAAVTTTLQHSSCISQTTVLRVLPRSSSIRKWEVPEGSGLSLLLSNSQLSQIGWWHVLLVAEGAQEGQREMEGPVG